MPAFGFTTKTNSEVITQGQFSDKQSALQGFSKIKGLTTQEFQQLFNIVELTNK